MAKTNRPKVKSKQFTKRETILLIVLAFAAAIYAFVNFILVPTMDEIAVLKTEIGTLQTEYTKRTMMIAQKGNLQQKAEENSTFVEAYKANYFGTTNQEHFIKVLDLNIMNEELDVLSLAFTDSAPTAEFVHEEGQESLLQSNSVTFPFTGSYESIMDMIKRVEQFKQMIRINSLDLTYAAMPESQYATSSQWYQSGYNENPKYQGTISVEFFTVPQDYESPWYSVKPNYEKAGEYQGSLFLFEDGGLGIPPFFREKEPDTNGPIASGGTTDTGNEGTTGGNTSGSGTGSTGGSTGGSTVGTGSQTGGSQGGTSTDDGPATYTVKAGDTVFRISMKFYGSGAFVDDIMALNNLLDPTLLKTGSVLKLPAYSK